ncbi:methyl-accepting chemotaxis protein [Balneatrix alpica]|uniref:methyl-accepting chemotaxis protein n=1 Tax=Balneatrix alpica TaxID=75684 RepID=UPI002738D74D|nr:methyl-accepting chemotaxis protein [Balneatrix alpica]
MSIRWKLLIACLIMSIVPVTLVGLVVGGYSISTGKASLETQAEAQLISIRDIKKNQIESYFDTINKQVQTLSINLMTVAAIEDFRRAFAAYQQEVGNQSGLKESLASYYQQEFLPEYQRRNGGQQTDVQALLNQLDSNGVALQHALIRANENPLGSKHLLDQPALASAYQQAHSQYHPVFRQFLEQFGYYDIFLVEPENGYIVYSVFKELDFATSLKNGAYANTGIGEAFKRAMAIEQPGQAALTDFAPYLPSYNDPASFIGMPIWQQGKKLGVLIFQMPIDRINSIMTHDQRWQESGLGSSGETYLVGADFTMRSMSRFLIEDPKGYLQLMQEVGLSNSLLTQLANKLTSIGLQPVRTQGTEAAISGKTDFAIFPDYRGVPVLSAYAPLAIPGLQWAIMSEIDEEEAFAPSRALVQDVGWLVAASILGTIVVVALITSWLAGLLTRPINTFTTLISDINAHSDLRQRLPVEGNDEIGQSAKAINNLLVKFQDTLKYLDKTIHTLNDTSGQMENMTGELNHGVAEQLQESQLVATAATQMSQTILSIADNAEQAAKATHEANRLGSEGQRIIHNSVESIGTLAGEVEQVGALISKVAEDSNNISGVLGVIQGIAEQTNLLALNAAIEAARAGEQGRGFAVVADEVRALAQRTQDSTKEIHAMVERLQAGTKDAVAKTQLGRDQARTTVEQAEQMRTALADIIHYISDIARMNAEVAQASAEQQKVAEDISTRIHRINRIAEGNNDASNQTAQTGGRIANLAHELQKYIGQFKGAAD